jgi:hypothetical protein
MTETSKSRPPSPSHGRPAEQRERQGRGHVPLDADRERAEERAPPYRGDVTGGVTFDRGRNVENERPASVHPPLRGDEATRALEDETRREALENARRTEANEVVRAPPAKRVITHHTEEIPRERGSIHKIDLNR